MGRTTKAQYAKHYAEYQSKPAQIEHRDQRNAARAKMEKTHGKAALAGKDVHHKKSPMSGGSNADSNLSIRSRATNRASKKKR